MILNINYFDIILNIVTVGTLIVTILMLKESKQSRKSAIKPILIPNKDMGFDSYDKLFLYNYDYPIQEFEYHGMIYFCIKNIGKGPACNVKIESVNNPWNEIDFKIGTDNYANIPEDSSIPIIFRVGYTNTEFMYGYINLKLSYKDILGKKYSFTVDLWLNEIERKEGFICKANPLRYNNSIKIKGEKFDTVIFREIENAGYYELNKIQKRTN